MCQPHNVNQWNLKPFDLGINSNNCKFFFILKMVVYWFHTKFNDSVTWSAFKSNRFIYTNSSILPRVPYAYTFDAIDAENKIMGGIFQLKLLNQYSINKRLSRRPNAFLRLRRHCVLAVSLMFHREQAATSRTACRTDSWGPWCGLAAQWAGKEQMKQINVFMSNWQLQGFTL